MAMREKYTTPGTSIYYYLVEWDPAKLSWEDFRGKVLGATDPKDATDGALRKEIFKTWKALGLKSEPNVGDNGVHASASPFEAMAERLNWLGATLETDAFGKAMIASGIPKATIMAWTKDPQVPFEGKKASLFDLLEDLDYDECLAKAQAIAGVSGKRPSGKQQAYVFIKPHAVTDKTKALAAKQFAAAGITVCATPASPTPSPRQHTRRRTLKQRRTHATAAATGPLPWLPPHPGRPQGTPSAAGLGWRAPVRHATPTPTPTPTPTQVTSEGSLGAEIIEKNKLIDNHYYAIANKASLSKPAELNPPVPKQEDFEKKFGISWKAALAKGIVYNAVDGCKQMGIDGTQMDKQWAAAKKAGNLVKFGGGFYAGKVEPPK